MQGNIKSGRVIEKRDVDIQFLVRLTIGMALRTAKSDGVERANDSTLV